MDLGLVCVCVWEGVYGSRFRVYMGQGYMDLDLQCVCGMEMYGPRFRVYVDRDIWTQIYCVCVE